MASGPADPQTMAQRWQTCQGCMQADSQGMRLFRAVNVPMYGQVAFCGAPRIRNIYRDEFTDGCGCALPVKIKCATAQCPRGLW
jgi:hypothetical protein